MNDTKRKLLILDLDETLIFSDTQSLERREDFKIDGYYVYKRPDLNPFLKFCFINFDVAVWTSSTSDYADLVIKNIFPNPNKAKFVWCRERCTQRLNRDSAGYYWIKDLKKVKRLGYDLGSVIMIDDSTEKLERNYGNHIFVTPYYGAKEDDELGLLQTYLLTLKDVSNVREIEKRGWKRKYLK